LSYGAITLKLIGIPAADRESLRNSLFTQEGLNKKNRKNQKKLMIYPA
jgi:hypothetical protein